MVRIVALVAGMMLLASSAHAQPTLTTIRVGLVPTDDITPLVYAIRSGMFRKEGLDVQYVAGNSGTAMAAAVVSGSYEFGKSSLLSIINAYLRGLPLVMIASEAVYDERNPYAQFVVAADSPYRTAKDLNGKTVGTPALNDLDQLTSLAWIDKNGGDTKSVHFVELPQSAAIAAVGEHRVDGTVLHYPLVQEALESGKVRAMAPVYSGIAPFFVFAGFFTSKAYAEAHPDIVRKFVQTVYRAAAYTNKHHAETVQMMAEATKVQPEVVARMNRVDGATSLNPKDIQPTIDVAAKYHLTLRAFPASEMLQYAPNVR
ncbi:MAG TPA: ABC transporter substrate-binding protein [Candidatus Binatia bacterium]|nr:ABC transporter substrate-binding protein [Candidatus Binatia bacterium]